MAQANSIEFKIVPGLTTVKFNGTVYDITPDSAVTVYTNENIQRAPADRRASAKAAGPSVRISPDYNAFAAYGARIKITEGGPVISTNGNVLVKPVPPPAKTAPETGDKDDNGWTYLVDARGKPLLVAPEDSGVMRWSRAKRIARAQGARLPSDADLFQMYNQKTVLDGLDETGVTGKSGLYSSSVRGNTHDFKYGNIYHGRLGKKRATRLVK
jgi:hypothetical protein